MATKRKRDTIKSLRAEIDLLWRATKTQDKWRQAHADWHNASDDPAPSLEERMREALKNHRTAPSPEDAIGWAARICSEVAEGKR